MINDRKWVILTLSLLLSWAFVILAVNLYVDHHAVRLSLFSFKKDIGETVYPDGTNQQIFNAEHVFRNPEAYDSFLFGSSRSAVIAVEHLPGRFYNMSYPAGLLAQHVPILQAMLNKGIKIDQVVIGLDDFSFRPASFSENALVWIMHPDAGGPNRLELFFRYFFRKPSLTELKLWKDRVLLGKMKARLFLAPDGTNLGWRDKDQLIEQTGKPIFSFQMKHYEPTVFNARAVDTSFRMIEEVLALSREHGFSVTFFILPLYSPYYATQAESLFAVKKRLAGLVDYYDFSGFNSVTNDPLNFYDFSHCRFRVGDMMAKRVLNAGDASVPDDFGVRVTQDNIEAHLAAQRKDLDAYLRGLGLKP